MQAVFTGFIKKHQRRLDLFLETLAVLVLPFQGRIQRKEIKVTKTCQWNMLTHVTHPTERNIFTV